MKTNYRSDSSKILLRPEKSDLYGDEDIKLSILRSYLADMFETGAAVLNNIVHLTLYWKKTSISLPTPPSSLLSLSECWVSPHQSDKKCLQKMNRQEFSIKTEQPISHGKGAKTSHDSLSKCFYYGVIRQLA